MRMSRTFSAVGVSYLLFLIAFAPATLLQRLPGLAQDMIVQHPSGTLWSGRMDALQIPTSLGPLQISNVQWHFRWGYLWRGEIAFQVETADAVGALIVAQAWHGLHLRQIDLSLPAADVARMLPALALLQPGGEVRLQGQDLLLSSSPRGKAELFWNNASLNLSPVQPLGNYQLHWQGDAQGNRFEVQTLQGKLFIEGTGRIASPQHWRFQGTAQTEPQFSTELRPLLEKIGKNNGDGVYRIDISGS